MKENSVDIAVNDRGMTELHLASYNQDIELVKKCVENKFDINKKDDNGWTPLIWAIDMAMTSDKGVAETIIKLLLDNGASAKIYPPEYESLAAFAHNVDAEIGNYFEALTDHKS